MSLLRNRNRHRGERGSTAVEAAVILPIFMALVLATIDGGLIFKSYLTLGHVAEAAARADAASADNPLADYQALQAVKTQSAGLEPNSIKRIVVFHPSESAEEASDSCLDGSAGSKCNVYTPDAMNVSSAAFPTYAPSLHWDATDREISRAETADGADLVGVNVQAQVSTLFSIFGFKKTTLSRSVIIRIEARAP